MKKSATVNKIFQDYGKSYRALHPGLSLHEKKVIRSIEICRTEALGGRIEECTKCDHRIILYNSCRNRHCPQCQFMKKEAWILERKKEVLPFTYFHVVFTLPDKLKSIVIRNKRSIYNLLFLKCKETLLSVSSDEKYFGADIGFFAILHTWGQLMNLHPHLHCVVPGGGYCKETDKWIKSRDNYLVPVEILKRRFRSMFLTGLKELYRSQQLYLQGTAYQKPDQFQNLIDSLFSDEWVVYIKESFQGKESVIEYLGRYTHRIAISNNRIIDIKNNMVSFKYRDYKDGNIEKIMKIDVFDFIDRFLIHVVPKRFVRIRYFGLMAHRNKRKCIEACFKFYGMVIKSEKVNLSWSDIYFRKTGKKVTTCPACGKGELLIKEFINPIRYRAPPIGVGGI